MSAQPVNVLAVMRHAASAMHGAADDGADTRRYANALHEARDAVAELIAADREYDAAKTRRIEADNRITSGDRSDDAFRRQAAAHHAYDRAVARRAAAIARTGAAP
jgi:hypothetical protein